MVERLLSASWGTTKNNEVDGRMDHKVEGGMGTLSSWSVREASVGRSDRGQGRRSRAMRP